MKSTFAIAALAAAALLTPAAQADVVRYTATMSGLFENPTNPSPGTGSVVVDYDDVAQTLRINAQFSGLLGPTQAAHIHCCASPLNNAGVATTTPSFAGFPLGVTSGTFDALLDLTQPSSWNTPFINANGGTTAGAEARLAAGLAAGEAYFNIHTTFRTGGEIRGNLAVPEPATLALAAMALGVAGVARRRRV